MAASPLPSWGPKRGRKSYVTPTFSGIPKAKRGKQNQKWSSIKGNKIRSGRLTLAFSGPGKEGGNATSLLHSQGSPTPSAGCKIRSSRQQRGTKSEVAASPLPSQGPKRRRKCYATLAFSGIPNEGEQNQKWMPHPCLLGGPKEGGNYTPPLHSQFHHRQAWGAKSELAPNKEEQNQKWLPHPCLLGGPKEGRNATSPLHSRGSPTKGNKIRNGCLTPAFSGIQKRAEMLHHSCILGDPQSQARGAKSEVASNKGEQNQQWSPHPYLLGGPKEGGNATSPLHSRGSLTKGIKSEVAASPLPSRGPKRGRKCYITPTFSGIPNKGEQN